MTSDEIKSLQRGVGVTADGILGRGTLAAVFRKLGATKYADALAFAGNVWMADKGILTTKNRFCNFLGQVAHESAGFVYMNEIWGPTKAQLGYEGRKDLGNTQPGDGKRFAGHGPIQITGRDNHRKFGRLLGIDLEANPELAADPHVGMILACLYWDDRGLNAKADNDDILGITKAINGGTNGLDDRKARVAKARSLFV